MPGTASRSEPDGAALYRGLREAWDDHSLHTLVRFTSCPECEAELGALEECRRALAAHVCSSLFPIITAPSGAHFYFVDGVLILEDILTEDVLCRAECAPAAISSLGPALVAGHYYPLGPRLILTSPFLFPHPGVTHEGVPAFAATLSLRATPPASPGP
jgi:hypothetical protein